MGALTERDRDDELAASGAAGAAGTPVVAAGTVAAGTAPGAAAGAAAAGVDHRSFRRAKVQFVLLCLAVGLDALGAGMLFPLLARIQAAHHLPTYGLGVMAGAYFFAALAGQIGISRLLDGRHARLVLLGGLLIGVGAALWFGLAGSLWQLSAARALGGIGYGIVGPAALRAGTFGIEPSQHGGRLGRLSSAQMAGIVVGPLVGTVLASAGGLATPFEVLAVLLAVVFVALAFSGAGAVSRAGAAGGAKAPTAGVGAARPDGAGPGPTRPGGGGPGGAGSEGAGSEGAGSEGAGSEGAGTEGADPAAARRPVRIARRPMVALLLLAVGAQLPIGLYDALWSRLLTDKGAGSLLIGLSLTIFGLPYMVLAPAGGRLASRHQPLVVAGIGLLGSAGLMAVYGFLASPLVITGMGVLEACAQAVAVPGGYAAVSRVIPEERAATGQGWFSGAGTIGAGPAALVGAPAYAAYGPGAVFAGGAVVSAAFVVAAIMAGRLTTERKRSTI